MCVFPNGERATTVSPQRDNRRTRHTCMHTQAKLSLHVLPHARTPSLTHTHTDKSFQGAIPSPAASHFGEWARPGGTTLPQHSGSPLAVPSRPSIPRDCLGSFTSAWVAQSLPRSLPKCRCPGPTPRPGHQSLVKAPENLEVRGLWEIAQAHRVKDHHPRSLLKAITGPQPGGPCQRGAPGGVGGAADFFRPHDPETLPW